jgi:hypothetical protein
MAAAWLSRGSGLVVPPFFLARRGELIANNARGPREHPYCWLLATGSILPGLVVFRGFGVRRHASVE